VWILEGDIALSAMLKTETQDSSVETTVDFFRKHGYITGIDIMTQQEAEEIRKVFDEYESWACNGESISANGNERLKTHLLLTQIAEVVRHPRILAVVEDLLGPEFVVWSSDWNIKNAGTADHFSWHQDSTYAALRPMEHVLTCWLAISEASEEHGCLRFADGSHLCGQLMHHEQPGAGNMLSRGQTVPDEYIDKFRVKSAPLRPGQMSIHHSHLVHSSGHNSTQEDRRIGLAIRYAATAVKGFKPESATLVSGEDLGSWKREPRPRFSYSEEAVAAHDQAVKSFIRARRITMAKPNS